MFVRRGINQMLGFQKGVTYTIEQTREKLMEAWTAPLSKFKGAALAAATTWGGLMSMLADKWYQFRSTVMDSGVFIFIKAAAASLVDYLDSLLEEGKFGSAAEALGEKITKTLKDIALHAAAAADAFISITKAAVSTWYYLLKWVQAVQWFIDKVIIAVTEVGHLLATVATPIAETGASVWDFLFAAFIDQTKEATKSTETLADVTRRTKENIQAQSQAAALFWKEEVERAEKAIEAVKNLGGAYKTMEGILETVGEKEEELREKAAEDLAKPKQKRGELLKEEVVKPLDEAKAALIRMRAENKTTLAEFDILLERGARSIGQYFNLRQSILTTEYATELRMLNAQLDALSTTDIRKRELIMAKIAALRAKKEEALAKIDEETLKRGESTLKNLLTKRFITYDQYYAGRERLLDAYYQREAKQIRDSLETAKAAEKEALAIQEEKLDALKKKFLKERLALGQRASATGLAAIDTKFVIEKKKILAHQASIKAGAADFREGMEKDLNTLTKAGEQERTNLRQEGADNRLDIATKEARLERELAEEAHEQATQLGTLDEVIKAQQNLIKADYAVRLTELEKFFVNELRLMDDHNATKEAKEQKQREQQLLRVRLHNEQRLAEMEAAYQRIEDFYSRSRAPKARIAQASTLGGALDETTKKIAALGSYWDQYERMQTEKYAAEEQRLLDAGASRAEILANQYAYEEALADVHFTKVMEQAKVAVTGIEKVFMNAGAPMKGLFTDLGTIFEYFYEKSGKKSKDWARAMQATQIAVATIDTLAAGVKALLAGWSMGGVLGMVMGPAMMGAAIAAGMAKVAMMKAQTFAEGGKVGGTSPTSTSDNVPAMLTAGEFVQPVGAVKHYGASVMEAIRQKAVPRNLLAGYQGLSPRLGRQAYAEGGSVSKQASAALREGTDAEAAAPTIINVLDPNLFDQYFASAEGERTFLNMITRNQDLLQQVVLRR
jgi:hypothetical protein